MKIKFRGQRVDTKEWIYGSLINNMFFIKPNDILKPVNYVVSNDIFDYDCWEDIAENIDEYQVIPETVGQCLCHEDIRGKEAHTGDILKTLVGYAVIKYGVYSPDDGGGNILGYYVEFAKESSNHYYRKDVIYWLRNSEIVGNEFDNPELLEVE